MPGVQNADIKLSINKPFFVTDAVLNCPQSYPYEFSMSKNDRWLPDLSFKRKVAHYAVPHFLIHTGIIVIRVERISMLIKMLFPRCTGPLFSQQ
jgi:hypothetical protein